VLGGNSRDEIGTAARRERHDHLDRALRPLLRRRLRRSGCRNGAGKRDRRRELGKMNAHIRPPWIGFVIAGLDPAIHRLRKIFCEANGPPGQARG
jgi:hypothetical protein